MSLKQNDIFEEAKIEYKIEQAEKVGLVFANDFEEGEPLLIGTEQQFRKLRKKI